MFSFVNLDPVLIIIISLVFNAEMPCGIKIQLNYPNKENSLNRSKSIGHFWLL